MLSIVMLRIHVFDDERKAIEEVIATLNHNNVQLVHIERLEPRKAIAFYRYDDVLDRDTLVISYWRKVGSVGTSHRITMAVLHTQTARNTRSLERLRA